MNREELIITLGQSIALEEVSTLANIADLEEIILSSGFDDEVKNTLQLNVKKLRYETIGHSKLFSKLLSEVTKSEKNEF